jgi:membrane protein
MIRRVREAATRLVRKMKSALARVLRAMPPAATKYTGDRGPQLAAAISYHVLFSLVPLFIFLASIAGLLLQDDELRQDLIDKLLETFPLSEQAGIDLERILSEIPTPASAIGIISILGFLWTASGMMGALRIGLTVAFDDGTGSARPYVHSKLVDFLLVLAVGVIVLVSFGLSIVVHAVEHWSETLADVLGSAGFGGEGVLGVLVPLALTVAAFALAYHIVPPLRPPLRQVWIAALLAGTAFELVKVGFSYYLATLATYDVLYGSLGSLFAFLFVVYLEASVFLFGAELAYQWPRSGEPGPPSEHLPLSRRLLGALRGLFVRRV